MSTRSYIAQTLADRKETQNVKSDDLQYIYCHFDGYIKGGVGETLLKYYSETGEVAKIFEHGDISSLPNDSSEINEQAYNDETRGTLTTCEYQLMRDLSGDIMIEYVYLWKDNKWNASYMLMEKEDESYFGIKSYQTKFLDLQEEYNAIESERESENE